MSVEPSGNHSIIKLVNHIAFSLFFVLPAHLSAGQPRFKNIKIFLKEKRVEISGSVCLDAGGPLEYLLVTTTGKTHESLFKANLEPKHLQIALLSIGCVGGRKGPKYQGDSAQPTGTPLQILVRFKNSKGKLITRPAEDFVYCNPTKTSMKNEAWVFTGSRFLKMPGDDREIFASSIEGSLIAIYHDPDAVIDNRDKFGDDDTAYTVNENLTPRADTPVTIIITPKKSELQPRKP